MIRNDKERGLMDLYYKFSKYLKDIYKEKVYKIPINLPITCPNRDGTCGKGGCSFCGEIATGFESQASDMDVENQILANIENISKKYKANKFIAYFQNFSNTYMPLSDFEKYIKQACIDNVVEICVSTRPDCIHDAYLDILSKINKEYGVNISIELGLQSINHKTLNKINRGHTLAEFLDATLRIRKYDFKIGVHLILNLPWDDLEDISETAKVLSALKVDTIKIHSLYILRNTALGHAYEKSEFHMSTVDDFVDKVVTFIRLTSPDIAFQRLLGRAPKSETLFCNWDMSWWRIQEMIESKLEKNHYRQGDLYNYLNGKGVKRFV